MTDTTARTRCEVQASCPDVKSRSTDATTSKNDTTPSLQTTTESRRSGSVERGPSMRAPAPLIHAAVGRGA